MRDEEEDSQEHKSLNLQGPHGSLSFQAMLMGDNQGAAYVVTAVENAGFKGSASFRFEATRLVSFVKGLDGLRRGKEQQAVFEVPQYPDCKIIVEPAPSPEFVSIKGIIGSVIGVGHGLGYRLSVRFGFYFDRKQLDQLRSLSWSRPHVD